MEKQLRVLIALIMMIFLSTNLVGASSISTQKNEYDLQENFQLTVSGSGFYALELIIPSGLAIISDPSNGKRTGSIYKTVSTGSLVLGMRGIEAGNYVITGQYSDGGGVIDLNIISININEEYNPPSCEICPRDSSWSNCENGKSIKQYYECSAQTNYECKIKTEEKSCISEELEICDVKWVCSDEFSVAYRSSDCSLSSIQKCQNGCKNGACIIDEKDLIDLEKLDVEINKEGFKYGIYSIFNVIWESIKKTIDFLIFWN